MMNPPTIRLLALVFCVLFAPCAGAEEVPPLVTDRPDFTESAETVPRGGIQLEFGYTYGKDGDVESHSLGELLLRAALGGRAELRLGLNSWAWQDDPGQSNDGLENVFLGAKFMLLEAPDEPGSPRPGMALLVGTGIPTGSDQIGEKHLEPGARLALAWDLNGRAGLSTNIGYAWISQQGEGIGELSGSLALGYGLTDSVGCYIEYYQFVYTEAGSNDPGYVNGGLTWLTTDNFQLDWRAGYQVTGEGSEFFTGIGGSWRWLRRNN
jgi:hypothetical protein